MFTPSLSPRQWITGTRPEGTHALEGIDLTVHRGESIALLGSNGSGKSTLLRLIAGTLRPSHGQLTIRGRVGGIIDLMGGLHPDLTGRENIRLQGTLLGVSSREMDSLQPSVEDFAELEPGALDLPVRTYSLGMLLRVGFSVAIHTSPDVFIIDEALAVGDGYFQWKCLREIERLKDRGTTLLFVSHLPDQAEALCQRALWLDRGRVRMQGSSAEVAEAYHAHLSAQLLGAEPIDADQALAALTPQIRVGSGKAIITGADFLSADGTPTRRWVHGKPAALRLTIEAREPITQLAVALALERVGQPAAMVFSPDLNWTQDLSQGTHQIHVSIPQVTVAPGHYFVSLGIHENASPTAVLDSHMKWHSLTVEPNPTEARPPWADRRPSLLHAQPRLSAHPSAHPANGLATPSLN